MIRSHRPIQPGLLIAQLEKNAPKSKASTHWPVVILTFLALFVLANSAPGVASENVREPQGYGWQPAFFGAGIIGSVHATTVYQGQLVFAGRFTYGGVAEYNGIARWDGNNLFPLGTSQGIGITGQVNALTVYNDTLIVAGDLTDAGGISVSNIAQWDGQNWSSLPQGTSGPVHALTVFEDELIVGGDFDEAGGKSVYNIARWDGANWSALASDNGSGTSGQVLTLSVYNSQLVAGGQFFLAGEVEVRNVARWNGSEWHPLAGPEGIGTSGVVRALQEFNGELVVGGDFGSAGSVSASRVARWNGSQWAGFDGFFCCTSASVRSLAAFNNHLIAGGRFDWGGGIETNSIVRWNGTQWQAMDGPAGPGQYDVVNSLEIFENELIIGAGDPHSSLPTRISGIIRWAADEWLQLSGTGETGLLGAVTASLLYEDQIVVGGDFVTAGSEMVNHIARWNGSTWEAIGAGLDFPVSDLTIVGDQLVAVGSGFVEIFDGHSKWRAFVAIWDGETWSYLPNLTGTQHSYANAVIEFDDRLIVGGNFSHADGTLVNNIAQWNGIQWEALQMGGSIGSNGTVFALTNYDDQLIVGGSFSSAGGQLTNNIARWDGTSWRSFPGDGVSGFVSLVYALAEFDNNLYVGGRFSSAGDVPVTNVAGWNEHGWHALGSGTGHTADSVISFGGWNGELMVGGTFSMAGDLLVNQIARWDGMDWIALTGPNGTGVTNHSTSRGRVFTLLSLGETVLVGGNFDFAGGVPSWNLGEFTLQPSTLEIIDRSPVISNPGELIQVTAQVHGTATAPSEARGTIHSSSGDSCTTLLIDNENDTTSSFTCSLEISSSGLHELKAVFSASPTHKSSTSQTVSHLVRVQSETSITGLSPDSSQAAGQPVQIFVDVAGSSPEGTVHVGDGDETLCTIKLPEDNCRFILHETGPVTLIAHYSGDDMHGPSNDSVAYEITESSLAFAPNPLDFGAVGVGHSSETRSIMITNTTDYSLSIDEFMLPSDSAFSQSGGNCDTPPFTLAAGSSCTLEFQFLPIQPGIETFLVEVQSDAPEGPHVFTLQGSGMDSILHDRFENP